MERLTSIQTIKELDGKTHEQVYCFGHLWGPAFFKKGTKDYEEYLTIVKRLAEYEALEEQCIKENSWCLRLLLNKWKEFFNDIQELYEYRKLEEQGKLLKLPCAVGDTVYTNVSMQEWYFRKENRPYEAKIVFIGINGVDNFMNVDFGNGRMLQFKFSDISKTMFLTQEEAKAALKKMENREV